MTPPPKRKCLKRRGKKDMKKRYEKRQRMLWPSKASRVFFPFRPRRTLLLFLLFFLFFFFSSVAQAPLVSLLIFPFFISILHSLLCLVHIVLRKKTIKPTSCLSSSTQNGRCCSRCENKTSFGPNNEQKLAWKRAKKLVAPVFLSGSCAVLTWERSLASPLETNQALQNADFVLEREQTRRNCFFC